MLVVPRKIIGARFYESSDSDGIRYHSPRDGAGHGTHVASTAAGSAVANASYYGLAEGTAKGGSPGSRIAMYRVCVADGCHGSSIMKAFDDAIADGVDVLSLSLGAPSYVKPELTADPIAIGAFHAVEKGITVVCSAGNDGPTSGSVVNDAPWIITVAASTIDRDFESDVVLGNKKVIKPDISAPGVNILAAWLGNDSSSTPQATKSPLFNVISGTSMSCPHVSGVVAYVKSQNPTWSPSAIKSAIMTTAIQTNNLGSPMTLDTGSIATPYDYGAGEISTNGALQPGLVYETSTTDYLNYLCSRGYNRSTIKNISTTVPDGFDCPKNSTVDYISNMNYPSIAVSELKGKESKKVTRTVTNVGGAGETVYTVSIDAPEEVDVKVIPDKLKFGKNNEKQSYQVIFTPTVPTLQKEVPGSITWTNGKYRVRSPFVVTLTFGMRISSFSLIIIHKLDGVKLLSYLLIRFVSNLQR